MTVRRFSPGEYITARRSREVVTAAAERLALDDSRYSAALTEWMTRQVSTMIDGMEINDAHRGALFLADVVLATDGLEP